MAGSDEPSVGLVTDSDLNRHVLQSLLQEAGYVVAVSVDSTQLVDFVEAGEPDFDAWLVDLSDGESQQILDLLEYSVLPLLVNDEIPSSRDTSEYASWQRRLLEKLEVVAVAKPVNDVGAAVFNRSISAWARKVWVLAASLGGPEAVKCFLDNLPADLPLAMVYGQHIEANFNDVLVSAVGSNPHYTMQLMRGEQILMPGNIVVVPADRQLRFLSRGRVVETRKLWQGQYQPALDQVIAELAKVYRENLGVIIFSGTCNDGEIGCRVAKAYGSTVWAQSPASCISSAMPDAAIATGCVSRQGTPEQLAQALVQHCREAAAKIE